jgi:prepilin-type N-terminal cleavage/methylation domain-containing protein
MRIRVPSSLSRPTKAGGFTLVEILVVVVVIALLVTVIMPTLGRARELGRQAFCLSNHRNIVNAVLAYHAEYHRFPYNYAYYKPDYEDNPRWALGMISPYLGGSPGVVNLHWLDQNEPEPTFPKVYVCPSADLSAVYAANPEDKYHACYWTNIAIRVNRGWEDLFYSNDGVGHDSSSEGPARIWGLLCPPVKQPHFRSIYHPGLDSLPVASETVFTGDTNDGGTEPGRWRMAPGVGELHHSLGFDRHNDRQLMSYLDGGAKAVTHRYLDDNFTLSGMPSRLTGDFLIRFTPEYSCGGTRIHTLPPRVVE